MSRPESKDIFAPKPGLFSWMRDRAYDFVYHEIGAGLDFVGDLFRGPSGYSESLHRQASKAHGRTPTAPPLTISEQRAFADMLHRRAGEGQVAYWKRKKALLNHPDKKALLQADQRQNAQSKIAIEANTSASSPLRAAKAKQSRGQRR